MSSVTSFWDNVYETTEYSRTLNPTLMQAALDHFGDIRGKSILEIGCGTGTCSLFFASHGANVTSVDISASAIGELNGLCRQNGITNVRGICANVLELGLLDRADFVFGSMILHHIEPFNEFARQLKSVLKPDGRAFFYENNAASQLLVWFRQNVVGHLWIPKNGDDDEFPLTPSEVDELRKHFDVEIIYPEMLFFGLVSTYLLRGRMADAMRSVDRYLYRKRWLLRYSYRQYVRIWNVQKVLGVRPDNSAEAP
jgi:2-polyprenyl-3-methyl-5-hydroxy-6-metoxy-1,4-benzoquinol methylase